MDGDPRIRGAEEAEDRIAAVVEQRGGEGERRVVGCLQPQLEDVTDDSSSPSARRPRLLVETQAEEPGSAGTAFEAAVDPFGDAPFECAEPGVEWQLRLDRGEAVEEELGRARPVAHDAVSEPYPRRAKAVAGDLVDSAGIEIVHEGVRSPSKALAQTAGSAAAMPASTSCTGSSIVAPQ